MKLMNMTKISVENNGKSDLNEFNGGELNYDKCEVRILNSVTAHFCDHSSQGESLLNHILMILSSKGLKFPCYCWKMGGHWFLQIAPINANIPTCLRPWPPFLIKHMDYANQSTVLYIPLSVLLMPWLPICIFTLWWHISGLTKV